MPTIGGTYKHWSSTLDNGALIATVGSLVYLFFAGTPVAWVLLGVSVFAFILIRVVYYREFRWLRDHAEAMFAYELGDLTKAEELFRRSADYAQTFGERDNRLAQAFNNLAAIYESQQHYQQAEDRYREALTIYERATGPGPNRAAEVRTNLERLSQRQRGTGSRSSESLPLLHNAADLLQIVRSCRELRSLLERLVAAQDRLIMELSPDTHRAWKGATESFVRHLADHHGWRPESQADVDTLFRSVKNVAQELGWGEASIDEIHSQIMQWKEERLR